MPLQPGVEVKKNRHQSRSKLKGKKPLRCFICHKDDHFKCDFPKRRSWYKEKYQDSSNVEASIAQDGYDSAKAITILEYYYQGD